MQLPESFYNFIPKAENAEDVKDIDQMLDKLEAFLNQKGVSKEEQNAVEALIKDLKKLRKPLEPADVLVTMSFSKHITEDYRHKRIKWEDLGKLANSKWNYSPSRFRGGYRDLEHYLPGNDCIVLDVDDGMSIFEATEIIKSKGLKGLITTTKSHQKDKNGVVCDRFRMFLPALKPFRGSVKDFSNCMIQVFKIFNNRIDPATKDASRFYYGNEKGKSYYVEGVELLDWKKLMVAKRPNRQRRHYKDTQHKGDSKHIENWFSQNISVGQRNTLLYRAKKFFEDEGLSRSEVMNKVVEINSKCSDPLDEHEVRQVCRVK